VAAIVAESIGTASYTTLLPVTRTWLRAASARQRFRGNTAA